MTRIVHTADWHLGARLVDCDRLEEQRLFLDWLLARLAELRPDLLIVAGDIFDSANPPQEALRLYYEFLARLITTAKCQTLILGGNHDSPATLHAPREILRALDVRVIGTPAQEPKDALLEFADAVVCAAPYIRERDIRTAAAGQSSSEVAAAIRTGIANYYRSLHAAANALARGRAIIATGHLTAVGSLASPSERLIHVGNLGAVDAACFDWFAYVALGHIHRPQAVGANARIRYAGSPIPLSFAEVDMAKEIRVIDITNDQLNDRPVAIPEFRPLVRLETEASAIGQQLRQIVSTSKSLTPWVELTVADGRNHPDLDRQVREAARGLDIRVLKILAPAAGGNTAESVALIRSLDDLTPEEVFAERLRRESIEAASPEGQDLMQTFAELLSNLREETDQRPATL